MKARLQDMTIGGGLVLLLLDAVVCGKEVT